MLLLAVKALFFFADTGYRDFNRADAAGQPIPPTCSTGADCVYARYLGAGRGAELGGGGHHRHRVVHVVLLARTS